MDPVVTSVTMGTVSSVIGMFNQYLPRLNEIRHTSENPALVSDVRLGEAAAFTLAVSIGVIASAITKSYEPAMISIMIAIALIIIYEIALRDNQATTN